MNFHIVRTEGGWDVYQGARHIADCSTWAEVVAITGGHHTESCAPSWMMQP